MEEQISKSKTRGRRTNEQGSGREDILQAAIDVFAEHGFEGAKVAEIARRAGVHHPLISYYFTNKESLWDAALKYLWDELSHAFVNTDAELKGIDPEQRLRLFYRRYVLFSAKHPEIQRLVVNESFSPGPRLNRMVDQYVAPFHEITLNLIKEVLQGTDDMDPLHVMVTLNGAVLSFIGGAPLMRRIYKFDPMDQARALQMADAVIDVILNGIERGRDARIPD